MKNYLINYTEELGYGHQGCFVLNVEEGKESLEQRLHDIFYTWRGEEATSHSFAEVYEFDCYVVKDISANEIPDSDFSVLSKYLVRL